MNLSLTSPDETRRRCDLCDKWVSKSQLLRHKNTVHFKLKPYRCSFCPKAFGTSGHRRKHMSTLHSLNFQEQQANIRAQRQNESFQLQSWPSPGFLNLVIGDERSESGDCAES
ncbi:hypothetical protein ACHWQZ_G001470 [Mnemiopsis leidyi]